jgi:hypothetical protein
MSPPYLPICGISVPFQVKLYLPTLIFKMNFLYVCPYRSWSGRGWLIFFHARCVILQMSVYSLVIARECSGIGMPSPKINKNFMLSNNKFLGKCWYGRHPWIRLAMDSKRMVGKGINFILCLGTAYDVSSMESIGNYSVVFIDGKSMPLKMFLSLIFFALSSGTSTNLFFPLRRAYPITLCNFYFYLSLHLLL